MKRRVHHIVDLALVATTLMAVFVMVAQPMFADNTRKTIGRGRSAVPTSAIRYATPMIGAVDIIVDAIGKQLPAKSETADKKVQIADPESKESKIIMARSSNDVFTVEIDLAKDQGKIDLGIYNMLGKRLNDVYSGPAAKGRHDYTTSSSDLPEGVYICILKGDDFRRAAKFYLNR